MAQVRFGSFRLDSAERRLHRGAAVLPLRPKTFAVLEYLVARPGRLVTKEQLVAAVWPDTAVSDAVLKVCVREIREALGDNSDDPEYVETAHHSTGRRCASRRRCSGFGFIVGIGARDASSSVP